MSRFHNLSNELQTYIYEFDSTYHDKLESALVEMTAHRLFYYNSKNEMTMNYITLKNINQIFDKKLANVANVYKDSLKKMLMNKYNNAVRVNIIFEKSDEIYMKIIDEKKYNKDFNIQIPHFWCNNPLESIF